MARLRILAGEMRSTLGPSNMAVRTVYVATRLLGGSLSRRRHSRRSEPRGEVTATRWQSILWGRLLSTDARTASVTYEREEVERCYAELWQSLISWFSREPLCGGFRPAGGDDEVFAKCAKTSRFARQLIHAFGK